MFVRLTNSPSTHTRVHTNNNQLNASPNIHVAAAVTADAAIDTVLGEEQAEQEAAEWLEISPINFQGNPNLLFTDENGSQLFDQTVSYLQYNWSDKNGRKRNTIKVCCKGFDPSSVVPVIDRELRQLTLTLKEHPTLFDRAAEARRLKKAGCKKDVMVAKLNAMALAVRRMRGERETNEIKTVLRFQIPLEEIDPKFQSDLGYSGLKVMKDPKTPGDMILNIELAEPENAYGYEVDRVEVNSPSSLPSCSSGAFSFEDVEEVEVQQDEEGLRYQVS